MIIQRLLTLVPFKKSFTYIFITLASFHSLADMTNNETSNTSLTQDSTEPTAKLLTSITPAKAVDRIPAKYPISAAKRGQEGWVKLSYIIEKDGSVSNPIVEESSGLKAFEKSALRAIKKWKFSPAIENGKPVQQCNTAVQMDFTFGKNKAVAGATKKFIRHYKKINKLISENKLNEAVIEIAKLDEKPSWNSYESTRLALLKTDYYQRIADDKNYLINLQRAGNSNGHHLSDDLYSHVLQQRYRLEVQFGQYQRALITIEKLKTHQSEKLSKNNAPTTTKLISHSEKVKEYIDSQAHLFVKGDISEKGFWRHTLVRNNFAFTNVNGSLRKLDVRCNNKRHVYSFSDQSQWNIPKSWGTCHIYVYGDENTKFDLVESQPENSA